MSPYIVWRATSFDLGALYDVCARCVRAPFPHDTMHASDRVTRTNYVLTVIDWIGFGDRTSSNLINCLGPVPSLGSLDGVLIDRHGQTQTDTDRQGRTSFILFWYTQRNGDFTSTAGIRQTSASGWECHKEQFIVWHRIVCQVGRQSSYKRDASKISFRRS